MRTLEYLKLSRRTFARADDFYKEMARWMETREEDHRLRALEHALAYNKAIDAQLDHIRGAEVTSEDPAFETCLQHKQSLASQIQLLTR